MSELIGIREARSQLGQLVRRAAVSRERTGITDHGHLAAILINPDELADLEDSLALARYELAKERGSLEVEDFDPEAFRGTLRESAA